jgi:uncharacterized protein (TIGR03437 family)
LNFMKSFSLSIATLSVCAALFGPPAFGQQYYINTVAGVDNSPGWSGDGGPAISAQFTNPTRVAVDKQGNLYIADYSNFSVRKVDAKTGLVTTIAGNGSLGFSGDGGSGVGSQLSDILDVAVDSQGYVFIADALNARVRVVDPSGKISTFAGNGNRGYDGDFGQAANATLNFPAAVALDKDGNLYIADSGSATVRKVVRSTGVILPFAGRGIQVYGTSSGDGGPALDAYLQMPHSLAVDAAGNVFIGDIGTSSIRKVGTDSKISTYVSNIPAQNFAMDAAGAVYFPDYRSNIVQKILPGGTRLWIAGNGTAQSGGNGGPATAAQMNQPYGVAVDSAGNVYVADAANAVIRQLNPHGFSIGAVANAASFKAFAPPLANQGSAAAAISPGEIVALFGTGLGPSTLSVAQPSGGFFPTQVAGTQVLVNGIAAPLIYTSATVVAAIVPYAVNGLNSADVKVVYNNKTSEVTTVPVGLSAPGIFTADATGSGQAAALNKDLTVNSAANPAHIGDDIVLYVTGEGQTSPPGTDGKIATGSTLPSPLQDVRVTINGIPAVIDYKGAAPSLVAGVMQLNVQIPSGFAPGNAIPVIVTVGGVASPFATIAVTQ